MSHAEMEELARDLMSTQERVRSLLTDNQRLRDALTIMRHLDDAAERLHHGLPSISTRSRYEPAELRIRCEDSVSPRKRVRPNLPLACQVESGEVSRL